MDIFGLQFLKPKEEPNVPPVSTWNWTPAFPEWLEDPQPFPINQQSCVHNVKKEYTLIIGQETAECGALIEEMKSLNKPFAYIHWGEEEAAQFQVHIKRGRKSAYLRIGDQKLDLSLAHSIYVEPPAIMRSLERVPSSFSEKETIFIKRWISFLKDLPAFAPRARFFPGPPEALFDSSQKKLTELALAQEIGLMIPETILTNSPKEAEDFYKQNKGRILFRDFGTKTVYSEEGTKTFQVELLNPAKYDWSKVMLSPCIFQKYIEKKYDLRAVVIGEEVLVTKIHSQNSQQSRIDWREYDYKNVVFEQVDVCEELKTSLKKFVKTLGFQMGSFDLAVDRKERTYFLEMNRPGAWLFIEALSGSPIRRTLAEHLASEVQ